jgi:hypothetical protein
MLPIEQRQQLVVVEVQRDGPAGGEGGGTAPGFGIRKARLAGAEREGGVAGRAGEPEAPARGGVEGRRRATGERATLYLVPWLDMVGSLPSATSFNSFCGG